MELLLSCSSAKGSKLGMMDNMTPHKLERAMQCCPTPLQGQAGPSTLTPTTIASLFAC